MLKLLVNVCYLHVQYSDKIICCQFLQQIISFDICISPLLEIIKSLDKQWLFTVLVLQITVCIVWIIYLFYHYGRMLNDRQTENHIWICRSSSNYIIFHIVIDLQQVSAFLQVLQFPPPINLVNHHSCIY